MTPLSKSCEETRYGQPGVNHTCQAAPGFNYAVEKPSIPPFIFPICLPGKIHPRIKD